jgi:hypothetical protein
MRDCRIHIVESPGPSDFFDGHREGPTLAAALIHAALPTVVHTAVDLHYFKEALRAALAEHADERPVKYPILHLSMHGTEERVELTDGTRIAWASLREVLASTNAKLGGNLLVSMSACYGVNAAAMAHGDGASPFYALVGPAREVFWEDTVPAFVAFYTYVMRHDGNIVDGVAAMNQVIRSADQFTARYGDAVQQEWRAARQVNTSDIQGEIIIEVEG